MRAFVIGPQIAPVIFDVEYLVYPKNRTRHGLDQAERNARTLSEWLTRATGEFTEVKPILVLPRWYVELKAVCPVKIVNKNIVRNSFAARVANPLSVERIQRIAHPLTERCRLSEAQAGLGDFAFRRSICDRPNRPIVPSSRRFNIPPTRAKRGLAPP